VNRGNIKQLMANFAEDPAQSRFSGLYDDALNRAQEQFALDSKCLWKDAPAYSVAVEDAAYDLPSDFMWEKQVLFDGVELKPITRARIQMFSENDWQTEDKGDPKFYLIDPEEGSKSIRLYPIPQEAGTMVLTYYPLPAESTTDSATPLNGYTLLSQFHIGLAAYGAWLLLMNDQSTPEKSVKKAELMKIYSDKVTEAVDLFKNTASAPLRMLGGRYWPRDA